LGRHRSAIDQIPINDYERLLDTLVDEHFRVDLWGLISCFGIAIMGTPAQCTPSNKRGLLPTVGCEVREGARPEAGTNWAKHELPSSLLARFVPDEFATLASRGSGLLGFCGAVGVLDARGCGLLGVCGAAGVDAMIARACIGLGA
jgi:hypothetical protein